MSNVIYYSEPQIVWSPPTAPAAREPLAASAPLAPNVIWAPRDSQTPENFAPCLTPADVRPSAVVDSVADPGPIGGDSGVAAEPMLAEPKFGGRSVEIVTGDVLEWAASYDGPKFHALLCDPPYHLTSITERFGKEGAAPCQEGTDGAFARASRGFMGQEWDGGDIAFRAETWAALKQHLHPGAFIMAFAGSRGWHRQACAIEDAGFRIHPTIFLLIYGSGFPKSTRVQADDEEMRARFNGHRYGGQAMKPSSEPIIVAQVPYEGRPVDCIAKTGAGALWIEGGKIGTEGGETHSKHAENQIYGKYNKIRESIKTGGRWPANLAIQCSSDCGEFHAPDCPAAELDRQSGDGASPAPGSFQRELTSRGYDGGGLGQRQAKDHERTSLSKPGYSDCGGASRYYHCAVADQIENAVPFQYQPKPGREERDAGLGGSPLATRNRVNAGGLENDPKWAPVEARNPHPTVKSIDLCRWLATLLLPPPEYGPRRLLVPFAGTGTEATAAALVGWEQVTGIEQSAEYADLARARVAYWLDGHGIENAAPDAVKPHRAKGAQGSLFDADPQQQPDRTLEDRHE